MIDRDKFIKKFRECLLQEEKSVVDKLQDSTFEVFHTAYQKLIAEAKSLGMTTCTNTARMHGDDHEITTIGVTDSNGNTFALCIIDWNIEEITFINNSVWEISLLDDLDQYTKMLLDSLKHATAEHLNGDDNMSEKEETIETTDIVTEKSYPIHHEDPIVHISPRKTTNNPVKTSVSIHEMAFKAFSKLDHHAMYTWLRNAPVDTQNKFAKCHNLRSDQTNYDGTISEVFTVTDFQEIIVNAIDSAISKYSTLNNNCGRFTDHCTFCPVLSITITARSVDLMYVMQNAVGYADDGE